jgi:predicted neuraminidase
MKLIINKEYVFEEDRPFISCHASTVLKTNDGNVLAAWFGGTKEGADDVAVWLSRRTADGWGYPLKVADEEGVPHWNPVLFMGLNDEVILYYKVGHKISKWHTRFITSNDGGLTWSAPNSLVEGDIGGRGPVKNKPIRLHDGTILAPASIEEHSWDAFVDISYDQGQTWRQSELVPVPRNSFTGKGVIQPTLWESDYGKVHMLLRSSEGYIFRSDSEDGGKTWSLAYPTKLPNNNSGIDLAKLPDGRIVLAYNPVGQNWGPRTPLILSISEDNGLTWQNICVLENEEGEYSYPSIIADGKEILLVYTWRRERIAFWRAAFNDSTN